MADLCDDTLEPMESIGTDGVKRLAMTHVERAFDDAEADGLPPEAMAHAALFAALTTLVDRFGEDVVADLVSELPEKIACGSYTLVRSLQ